MLHPRRRSTAALAPVAAPARESGNAPRSAVGLAAMAIMLASCGQAMAAPAASAPAPAATPAPQITTEESAFGEAAARPAAPAKPTTLTLNDIPKARSFVSQHVARIGGQDIRFTVEAADALQYNDHDVPIGTIFSYSYLRTVPAGQQRPVVFITGGGPGAASFELQLGLGPWSLPPERLSVADGRTVDVRPPFPVVDNPNSLLDVADLVFIDPVGTGYSRIVGQGKREDFWGLDQDAEAMQRFMVQWLDKHGRWNSPKFFMGESYGGTRTAMVVRGSMAGVGFGRVMRGVTLNGAMILVNNLGIPGVSGDAGAGEAYAPLTFPNIAATAWYHGTIDRRGRSLQQLYAEATSFARAQLLPAVQKDREGKLAPAEREAVVRRLAEFTGLPASTWAKSLALTGPDYAGLILASRGKSVGVYDARFTTPAAPTTGDLVADDAALSRVTPVMLDAFYVVQREKMGVRIDTPYVGISMDEVQQFWDYRHRQVLMGPAYGGDAAGAVGAAMNRNEKLQVMMATGYYDLLFSPALAEYMAEKAGMPRDRLHLRGYETGHQLYIDSAGISFVNDLRTMIREATR